MCFGVWNLVCKGNRVASVTKYEQTYEIQKRSFLIAAGHVFSLIMRCEPAPQRL